MNKMPESGTFVSGESLMLELRQLRCFIAVAEELHFGKAAEKLGLAAPALSRQIGALESELGARLLARTTRHVTLTRAGLMLLEDARAVMMRLERTAQSVREASVDTSRVLRVGAVDAASSSFLPGVIATFRKAQPQVDFRFVEAMTSPLLQMLEAGKLDLVLTRPPRKGMCGEDCRFEVLRVERPLVLLPQGHALAAAREVSMLDLVNQPLILPSKRVRPYAHDLAFAYFDSVGASPRIAMEATEKPAVLSAVAAGLGIALAPDWLSRLSYPGVVMRRLRGALLDPPPPGALVGVAWRPQQKLHMRDLFLDLLREQVSLLEDDKVLPFRAPLPPPSGRKLSPGTVTPGAISTGRRRGAGAATTGAC
jgi:DNA-binding transcriptional LysR family regulator